MTGAIIIVGTDVSHSSSGPAGSIEDSTQRSLPLCCVEVLGRSVVDRTVEVLRRNGFDRVVVLNERGKASLSDGNLPAVTYRGVEDPWISASLELQGFKCSGIETVAIICPNVYAEIDLSDLLQCHRSGQSPLTRAVCAERPLDIWVLNSSEVSPDEELSAVLMSDRGTSYPVQGYVRFLDHPRDLRSLVLDSFNSKSRLRPYGYETRPGVWMSDGVEIHRGARIVAPAFVGHGSRIQEQCLITRCSNIESGCHVDYGTVVEDSAILPNTYVGIGLDISHSIVSGSMLFNLEREVTLQIADHGVIRPNRIVRGEQHDGSQSALRMAGTN